MLRLHAQRARAFCSKRNFAHAPILSKLTALRPWTVGSFSGSVAASFETPRKVRGPSESDSKYSQ
jgi:hypothetical protein